MVDLYEEEEVVGVVCSSRLRLVLVVVRTAFDFQPLFVDQKSADIVSILYHLIDRVQQ